MGAGDWAPNPTPVLAVLRTCSLAWGKSPLGSSVRNEVLSSVKGPRGTASLGCEEHGVGCVKPLEGHPGCSAYGSRCSDEDELPVFLASRACECACGGVFVMYMCVLRVCVNVFECV